MNYYLAPLIGYYPQPALFAGANRDVFYYFEELFDELIQSIVKSLDMPTKCSFSWTNRKYYRLYYNEATFDPYHFADKCAELGHRQLLNYSKACGGPCDVQTLAKAAAHGFYFEEFMPVDASRLSASDTVFRAAISGGHVDLGLFIRQRARLPADNTLTQVIAGLLFGGHWEQAQQIHEANKIQIKMTDKKFHEMMFFTGLARAHPGLVETSLARIPSVLGMPMYVDQIIATGVKFGIKRFLMIACEQRFLVQPPHLQDLLNSQEHCLASDHFDCLQFICERLDASQFPPVEMIPSWATVEALEWMIEKGFRFPTDQLLPNYLELPRQFFRMDVMLWILENGGVIDQAVILAAACQTDIAALKWLWSKKPDNLEPDSITLEHFISIKESEVPSIRTRVMPIFRTVGWLLNKGYEWGRSLKNYGIFAVKIFEYSPRLARDFIRDSHMPLTIKRYQRIFAAEQSE